MRVSIPRAETVDGKYQVFVVECEGKGKRWSVKHRYSAFDDLRKSVSVNAPFPGKSMTRLNAAQTEKRREQLEIWLTEVTRNSDARRLLAEFLDEPKDDPVVEQEETTVVEEEEERHWDESFMNSDPLAMLAPVEEPREVKKKPKPVKKVVEPKNDEAFFNNAPSFLLGAKKEIKYDQNGEGIRDAIKDGDLSAVTKILSGDPKLAAYTDRQMSMLHLACILDNSDIALALVEAGAKTDVKDQNDETPLDLAPPSLKEKIKAAASKAHS